MPDLTVKRTLVKSPPELWAELSEVEGLSRHLGEFGEIKISRLDPETTVAWEGEHASGTVEIEASSWGTKVVLTAEVPDVGRPRRGRRTSSNQAGAGARTGARARATGRVTSRSRRPRPWSACLEFELRPPRGGPRDRPSPGRVFRRWLFRKRRRCRDRVERLPGPRARTGARRAGGRCFRPSPIRSPSRTRSPCRSRTRSGFHPPRAGAHGRAAIPEPDPAVDPEHALAVLDAALDNLGAAHHQAYRG